MAQVKNRRAIIDRRALNTTLEQLAECNDPQSPACRGEVLAALKDALKVGREELTRRLHEGEAGDINARGQAYLIDQIIRSIFEFATMKVFRASIPTASEHMSVVAVGGYGRGEMAPFSDVDLLFLLPYKQTPWGESVVEYILYLLWDLRLKVGHATRTVDDCIRLARNDITIRTALLEARLVCGDRGLFGELKNRYQKEVVKGHGPEFVELKLAERDERHEKYGDTRYVVEPNLKEGKGGLRDLHTLFWIAKYLYRVEDIAELVDRGVFTPAEYRTFQKAHRFLWTVRCHLHDITGRAEERLTFDVQRELAVRLGYKDHAGALSIERFMKHYFLVAKDVGDLTRILCTALEEEHKRRRRFRLPRLGLRRRHVEGFVIEGDRVNIADAEEFAREPLKMLRLFHLAQRRELDIHPQALRAIGQHLKLIDRDFRRLPEANALFLDILTADQNPAVTLRRMNEAGVLGRFIPDFGRVVAQMQHDMYHHYTVDEHTIRAIGILWRIEKGKLKEDHPLADRIVHKVLSRRVLYLAVFLHDIAKGRGGDHSVLGARVARKLCPRLGLNAAETETVQWLVRYHLLLPSLAFKRDIADPKTISDLVEVVQSPERLRLLLVLTVADIRAVGPGVWNGWKGQLLRELYYRAEDAMSGGLETSGREERIAGIKQELAARLADWTEEERTAYMARHYDAYWLSEDVDTLERHARLIREADREGRPITLDTRIDRFQSVTEVTFYTADHPGLFVRITGAMAVCGASIVGAKVFTTADGMALDSLLIQDEEGHAFDQPSRLARLAVAVEQTLSGELRPAQKLEQRRKSALNSRTRVFKVAPVVHIDNNASEYWTVLEVNGRDRSGLLHDLAWTLFQLSLTIGSAHIATYGERAVDVFYVRDLFGLKVTNKNKLRQIEEALLEVLSKGRRPSHRRETPAAAEKTQETAGG